MTREDEGLKWDVVRAQGIAKALGIEQVGAPLTSFITGYLMGLNDGRGQVSRETVHMQMQLLTRRQ